MSKRETATLKYYVYLGVGAIRTDDGVRENIEAGTDLAKPFLCSPFWLRKHKAMSHRLMRLSEYEAKKKAEAESAAETSEGASETSDPPKKKRGRPRKKQG